MQKDDRVFRELAIQDVTDVEQDTFEVTYSFPALSKYFGRYHITGADSVRALLKRNLSQQGAEAAWKQLQRDGVVRLTQRFSADWQNITQEQIPALIATLFSTIEDLVRSMEGLTESVDELTVQTRRVKSTKRH